MPGVPRNLIEHSLNILKTTRPIKQKLRRFARDKKEAIRTEITRLLLRKCMILIGSDLNKHCPKDPFGLPRIDEVVDSTAGCELLSFLDCYSSYHQI